MSHPGPTSGSPVPRALASILAAAIAIRTQTLPGPVLPAIVASSLAELRAWPGEGAAFCPGAGVQLVRGHRALRSRHALARVLLRCEDDPSLFTHKPPKSEIGNAFTSSSYLMSDVAPGPASYLAPLYLALSPWLWSLSVARAPGSAIVYNLARPVIGRSGEIAEMLQLYSRRGGLQSGPMPVGVDFAATSAALKWWVGRLNLLFSGITDPASFCDDLGTYQPRSHFEVLLGVEQYFRHVQSILAQDRDGDGRRSVFFDALDTLEGLGYRTWKMAVTLGEVEKQLRGLRLLIPPEAAPVLLPNAERAVRALRGVQDGFVLASRVTATHVRLPQQGREKLVPKASAATEWLHVLRNAAHGFQGHKDGRARDRPFQQALLLAHNGQFPEDLPLVAYLQLLHMLADDAAPARLAAASRR